MYVMKSDIYDSSRVFLDDLSGADFNGQWHMNTTDISYSSF